MKLKAILLVSLLLWAGSVCAPAGLFSPSGKTGDEKRQKVRKQRDEMLADLYKAQPNAKEQIKKAVGYATFKEADMHLFMLATARGYGLLVDNKTGKETFMCVASLGGGVGLGIRDLRIVFIFNDAKVMRAFIEQGWEFGGKTDVSAKYQDTGVAAEGTARASIDFKDGTVAGGAGSDARAGTQPKDAQSAAATLGGAVQIYQFTESGVSLQATLAGTKYWKDKKLTQ